MGLVRRLMRPIRRENLAPSDSTALTTETVVSADTGEHLGVRDQRRGLGRARKWRAEVSSPHEEQSQAGDDGEHEKAPLDRRLSTITGD